MKSIAIKIIPAINTGWGNPIYFYENEVRETFKLGFIKTNKISENFVSLPSISDFSVSYENCNVDYRQILEGSFFLNGYNSLLKYKSLFQIKNKMKIYYTYQDSPDQYLTFILNPNREEFYYFGEYEANILVPVMFWRWE